MMSLKKAKKYINEEVPTVEEALKVLNILLLNLYQ
jgi:hypothetical protein